ncbi:hypothetical protein [Agilicoccus flavus]|uniref:hypothetical protein n=1 Tax=Agilicoccus flavus TaxID=2775968 RepID=UPI001CF6971E|nr:hypothetical protein [Agilicoccus flavus]
MSTHTPRTLATLVAFGLAGAGLAAPALAATTPAPKNIAVKATQYPRLIDNPGAADDVVRFTNVPGAAWKLGAAPVTFASGRTTADVNVTAASTATLAAVTGDETTWAVPVGMPTAWNYPAPSADLAPAVDVSTITAVFNDLPGATKDTVTLTNVKGVAWTVTSGTTVTTHDSTTLAGKASVAVPVTSTSTVAARLMPGYTGSAALPTFSNSVTATPEVALSATYLDSLVQVGENPSDKIKGYGPGAAKESVKVTGIPGVKWKVGSLAPKAVTGVGYLPVDDDDIVSGMMTVTAVAAKGYTVPAGWSKVLDFTDGATIPTIVVQDADVKTTDRGGISADTITLAAQQGMAWWVGQADAKGRIVYAAQKPGKNGAVVYKVKHAAKATTDATVYLKPVPNRGYVLDTTKLITPSHAFTREATIVAADNNSVSAESVTFKPYLGVTAWDVKYTQTVGTRTTTKTLSVKPGEIEALGATSATIVFPSTPKVTPKLAKDYRLAN